MDNQNEVKEQKNVQDIASKASREIIRIKTVFPFTLFPTEIIVDEVKITIITHWFMYRKYFPVLLKDLKTVTLSHNIFFASLTFEITGYETNPGAVGYLKKNEAIKAHQIIVGLTTVIKEKAENSLHELGEKELSDKLIEIGGTSREPNLGEIDLKTIDSKKK